MQIYRTISELSSVPGPVSLAIGVFDGLHVGHREVVDRAIEGAAREGGSAVVVTFDPHPATILRPDAAPRLLVSTPHKIRLFERAGLEHFLAVPFDREFAATPGRVFVERLVAECRPLKRICVGEDWAFGKGRDGNVTLLTELGLAHNFEVEPVAAVCDSSGEPVSSTRIRRLVRSGELDAVIPLLGREFTVLGTVIEGRRLGRTLGFPTANLRVYNEQLPPEGVYAVSAELQGKSIGGVGNLGVRPTVEGEGAKKMLEIHLFEDVGDIYGEDLEVRFVAKLRDEKKFGGLDELKAQIEKDVRDAKARLGND